MSSPRGHRLPAPAGAGSLAERQLFERLLDDAAVFPPGSASLPDAASDHLARRRQRYADLVGPLLIPAQTARALPELGLPEALDVVLIARPGVPTADLVRATREAQDLPEVTVAGVELGYQPDWAQALVLDLPLAVEVGPADDMTRALAALAEAQEEAVRLLAKLRTGATPTSPVPSAAQVASFVRECVDLSLSFKLTGGLHHAMPTGTGISAAGAGGGTAEHGFLGMLAATRWALNGAEVAEMESLIAERDPEPILDLLTRMSEADASVLRAFFTSFGCCGVLDPIRELAAFGLITDEV